MTADEILESFIAGRETSARSFDELCRQHPELAGELRDLWEGFQRAAVLLNSEIRPRTGRYEVRGEIARGGNGCILEAWDKSVGRIVAMKVLREDRSDFDLASESRCRSRLVNEAQILGQLEHPGIVPLYEIGEDDAGLPFFTMLRVRGRQLGEVIEDVLKGDAGWPLTRAVRVVLQVCEAMAYAHAKGVVHRDLKPANIMVGPFGEVFVMDWGLAKAIGSRQAEQEPSLNPARSLQSENELPRPTTSSMSVRTHRRNHSSREPSSPLVTQEGDILGTPSYMSPEQAEGRLDSVNVLSDVYGVGAILYHLLCGHPPYAPTSGSSTPQAVLQAVLAGPPRDIEQVAKTAPAELVSICRRAMARSRDRRYEDMAATADDLRAFLEGRVVQAHRIGLLTELAKWIRRNKGIAAAVVATLAGLIAVAVTSTIWLGRERTVVSALHDLTVRNLESVVDGLVRRADEDLWPVRPSRVNAMDQWIEEADGNLKTILEIAASGGELGEATLAQLDRLEEPLADVRRRRAQVDQFLSRRIEDQELWRLAAAGVRRDARFEGFELQPLLALMPLGFDRQSGLLELWHVESGSRPEWIGTFESGRAVPSSSTGLVLVLIPGGTFTMGREYGNQSPPNEVTLAPFLLSKYEVSQGQAMRCVGWNPSSQKAGLEGFTLQHPADSFTWFDAVNLCRHWGLELPTEAQWEYATRAGTPGQYWTGPDESSLIDKVNAADPATYQAGADISASHRDPFPTVAPIGSLPANPWGLHETLGNLWEWVYDSYESYTVPAQGPIGLRSDDLSRHRISRGGSYFNRPSFANAYTRRRDPGKMSDFGMGFRPASRLPPQW